MSEEKVADDRISLFDDLCDQLCVDPSTGHATCLLSIVAGMVSEGKLDEAKVLGWRQNAQIRAVAFQGDPLLEFAAIAGKYLNENNVFPADVTYT